MKDSGEETSQLTIKVGDKIQNNEKSLEFEGYNHEFSQIQFKFTNLASNETEIIGIKLGNWRSFVNTTESHCEKEGLLTYGTECRDDIESSSGAYEFRPSNG